MAIPKFSGADLMGDSIMLRFSLQHADSIPHYEGYPSSWGMCRDGQTAKDLLVKPWIRNSCNDSAIIMIGTHDILQISASEERLSPAKQPLKFSLRKVKVKAWKRYKHVYFCTVPEIPLLEEALDQETRYRYLNILPWVNDYIMSFGEKEDTITSVDLRGAFTRDCYESNIGDGQNTGTDDINLNAEGLAIMKEILLETIAKK